MADKQKRKKKNACRNFKILKLTETVKDRESGWIDMQMPENMFFS